MKTLLYSLLAALSCLLLSCAGSSHPHPKTPRIYRGDYVARAAFREGFVAGLADAKEKRPADHERHSVPAGQLEPYRSGYITGLTYWWPAMGKEPRIRREYPAYADAYARTHNYHQE